MSWEKDEPEGGWTRREWVKLGITVSAVASVAGMGGLVAGQILPPPYQFKGEVRETVQYTRFSSPQWWNSKAGSTVRVSDFQEWQGATGVWRGLYQEDKLVPGTGYPVIIIRIKRDDQFFSAPTEAELPAPLPAGFSLYFDDPDLDAANGGTRIVVLFDRCVHLCCYPGWHVVTNPPPGKDYEGYFLPGTNVAEQVPTYYQYGQDPVYCVCHGSQYEPMRLVVNEHPKSRAKYVGAQRVHGPASRALAVVPVQTQGLNLVGGMADPAWYIYC